MFKILIKKNCMIILLNNKLLFKQEILQNKKYTLLYVLHILNKYGLLVNKIK